MFPSSTRPAPPTSEIGSQQSKREPYAAKEGALFIPAVVDVYGAMGEGLLQCIQRIAIAAFDTLPYPAGQDKPSWLATYKNRLRHHLTIVLANANHLMIKEACMKAQCSGWSYSNTTQLYRAFISRHNIRKRKS